MDQTAQWLVGIVPTSTGNNVITWLVFVHVSVFLVSKVHDVMKVSIFFPLRVLRQVPIVESIKLILLVYISGVLFCFCFVAYESVFLTESNSKRDVLLYTFIVLFGVSAVIIIIFIVRYVFRFFLNYQIENCSHVMSILHYRGI